VTGDLYERVTHMDLVEPQADKFLLVRLGNRKANGENPG
jgi:hypothetical protein